MAGNDETRVLRLHRRSRRAELDGRTHELHPRVWAVLEALARGRVVSRAELARAAGLEGLSERRCDGLLVELRRDLGPDVLRNLRRRGWILTVRAQILED